MGENADSSSGTSILSKCYIANLCRCQFYVVKTNLYKLKQLRITYIIRLFMKDVSWHWKQRIFIQAPCIQQSQAQKLAAVPSRQSSFFRSINGLYCKHLQLKYLSEITKDNYRISVTTWQDRIIRNFIRRHRSSLYVEGPWRKHNGYVVFKINYPRISVVVRGEV